MSSSNTKLTLLYFPPAGRAGISRLILAYAGVEYDNKIVEFGKLAPIKESLPYGQLPTLTIEENGKTAVLAQSLAIARYLANRYRLVGHTAMDKAEADEVIDAIGDIQSKLFAVFLVEDKKAKLTENMPAVKNGLKNLESRLEARGGQHLAGNCLTWADLALHDLLQLVAFVGGDAKVVLEGCPLLAALNDRVSALPNVKKYDHTLAK